MLLIFVDKDHYHMGVGVGGENAHERCLLPLSLMHIVSPYPIPHEAHSSMAPMRVGGDNVGWSETMCTLSPLTKALMRVGETIVSSQGMGLGETIYTLTPLTSTLNMHIFVSPPMRMRVDNVHILYVHCLHLHPPSYIG